MTRLLIPALVLSLVGCTTAQLQANGLSASQAASVNTVVSTAVADGTLFCDVVGAVAAVPGVNVVGASAQSVANACATATLVGTAINAAAAAVPVPVPPPATPQSVPVATVPPAAASAVAASAKAGH